MKGYVLKSSLSLSPQAVLRSYSNSRKSGESKPVRSRIKSPLRALVDALNYDAIMHMDIG